MCFKLVDEGTHLFLFDQVIPSSQSFIIYLLSSFIQTTINLMTYFALASHWFLYI